MPGNAPTPKMAVVGGGIAGLTAALRLVERGFDVEVFEKGPLMGGNLSGVNHGGAYYDVYPHMFAEWFHNFWKLAEDIGLKKHQHFERRRDCGFLAPGEFPHYRVCTDIGALSTGLKNLSSGVISLPEMFLANYTILDAIARGDADKEFLENQTLNDFIVNRPYATRGVTHFFDTVVKNVWSIDSYLSSALAYQSFAKYQFREPSPQCWVLKGNSYENFIVPLLNALNSRAHAHMNTNAEVMGVTVVDGKVTTISYKNPIGGAEVDQDVDGLIIASSPASLGDLIFTPALKNRRDADAQSIVSVLPNLANVRRLGSDPLPVLYVTFKRKLAHIPSYYVALLNSKYSLTFVQIEELSGPNKTVLAVAASDFDALPIRLKNALAKAIHDKAIMSTLPPEVIEELKRTAHPILKELQRYIPFKLDEDIDWDNTFFQPNMDQKLFLNEVGSQRWTTEVSYPEINNLYFAGNSCTNSIMIATVESAVCSGLQAARAVVQRHRHLDAVSIIEPESYPTSLLFAWKIMLAPYAALAKIWVEADTLLNDTMNTRPRSGALAGTRAVSEIGRSFEKAFSDWCKVADSFWRRSGR